MSVIVAVGIQSAAVAWMGADSFCGHDGAGCGFQDQKAGPKVFMMACENGSALVGLGGSCRASEVIERECKWPVIPKSCWPDLQVDAGMLDAWAFATGNAVHTALKERDLLNEKKQMDGGGLLAVRGLVYELNSDFSMTRSAFGYAATGCGYQYAYGSLATTTRSRPEQRVQAALRASARHCPWVAAPFSLRSC